MTRAAMRNRRVLTPCVLAFVASAAIAGARSASAAPAGTAVADAAQTSDDRAAAASRIETDRVALALVRAGQWSLAAEQWSSVVPSHLETLSAADERRGAARSLVLAALAWERAGDVQAYRAWSDAIRLYLESGTTWEQERSRLKETSDNIDAALRQMPSSSAGPNRIVIATSADLLGLDLERELKLSTYNGPGPGLARGDGAQATASSERDSYAGAMFLPRAIDTSAEPPSAESSSSDSYLDPMPIAPIDDLLPLIPSLIVLSQPLTSAQSRPSPPPDSKP
jgi:hypothetical protein